MKTPKSWKDVTIAQYYNLCEAIEMDWETDTDKAVAMLSALSGISIKTLMEETDTKDLIRYINDIKFIGNDKVEGHPSPNLRIGNRRFVIDLMIKQSTGSSFISLTELSKTNEIAKVNIHSILAVFAYERNWLGIRKKRTAKSQLEIAEYFKANMAMDKAFVYSGFFLRSWNRLSEAMVSYSELKRQKAMKILAKEARNL